MTVGTYLDLGSVADGAMPGAAVGYRDRVIVERAGGGRGDRLWYCAYDGSGYAWELVAEGGQSKEVFWPVVNHSNATQGVVEEYAAVAMDDTQKINITGYIPKDWASTVGCYLVMIPDATEELTTDFTISAATNGESATTHTQESLNETHNATNAEIDEWDITSLLPAGYGAGDYLGVSIASDIDQERLLGIRFEYRNR